MFPITQDALGDIGVQNQVLPSKGPMAVPVTFDFNAHPGGYQVNLQNMQALSRFSQLQTIFVDNSSNTIALTLIFTRTNQTLVIQPGRQGYYPVLAPNPIEFTAASAGSTASVRVQLLNFPLAPAEWTGNSSNITPISVSAVAKQTGNADAILPLMIADLPAVASGVQASDFANFIAPGNVLFRYFIQGLQISATPDMVLSNAAGYCIVVLTDSADGIIFTDYLKTGGDRAIVPPGFSKLSAVNAKVSLTILDAVGGAAITLTTGKLVVTYNIGYGLFA